MREGGNGHLWQGRYYSCALDEKHVYAAIRYVENNPVRARIVRKAENYQWASARAHVRGVSDQVLSGDCYLTGRIQDWGAYLEEREDEVLMQAIRDNTRTGRPCGDDRFIGKVEEALGRRLVAMPRGRPRRST
jgi:putative transposase